jgi:hypothetical protein
VFDHRILTARDALHERSNDCTQVAVGGHIGAMERANLLTCAE